MTAIFQGVRRADDVLEGLHIFLSRRAELGMAIRGYPASEFASWISKPIPQGRVRVIYRYDDQSVNMLDAWLVSDRPF